MKMKKSKNWLERSLASNLGSTQGFTLIEMMIVIAIIALVLGFVGTNVVKRYEESQLSATKIQIRQLGVILDDFRRVCGRYPTTEEGLDALIKAPPTLNCKNFDTEGFIKDKKVPKDPWNEEYSFTSDGSKYVIKSMGASKKFAKEVDSDHLDD